MWVTLKHVRNDSPVHHRDYERNRDLCALHTVCLHGTGARCRGGCAMCVVPILQINDVNVNDIATQPPGPRYVRESRVSWGARVV